MSRYRHILAFVAMMILSLSVAHTVLHSVIHCAPSTEQACNCSCSCCSSGGEMTGCFECGESEHESCSLDAQYLPAVDKQSIKKFFAEEQHNTYTNALAQISQVDIFEQITTDDDIGLKHLYLESRALRAPPVIC